ncbi:MAG: hypothetical protein [Caudoviricetes sp.]|nr:MAG: hypothetical protein [Caudoviricetes sp.]
MLEKDTIIKLTNRSNGTVGYFVQDLNIRRDFNVKETKEVTIEELRKLSYQPGGKEIIRRCLIIDNAEAIKEILGEVEPEYFYSEEDVKKLLLSGSVDQLIDCLNYAPSGVIDLVKNLSVDLELNDIKKREIILQKTGFNITKAIEVNKEAEAEDDSETNESNTGRRSVPINQADKTEGRRAEPPKYKVTNIEE